MGRSQTHINGDRAESVRRRVYLPDVDEFRSSSGPLSEIVLESLEEVTSSRAKPIKEGYVADVTREGGVSPSCVILGLLYLHRLAETNPRYLRTLSGKDLFLTAMVVASKYLNDEGESEALTNSEWAEVGCKSKQSLDTMERQFLTAIDWRLYVSMEEYYSFVTGIEGRIALNQFAIRGWLTYTDMVTIWDTMDTQRTLLTASKQVAKVTCGSAAVYLVLLSTLFTASHSLNSWTASSSSSPSSAPVTSSLNITNTSDSIDLVSLMLNDGPLNRASRLLPPPLPPPPPPLLTTHYHRTPQRRRPSSADDPYLHRLNRTSLFLLHDQQTAAFPGFHRVPWHSPSASSRPEFTAAVNDYDSPVIVPSILSSYTHQFRSGIEAVQLGLMRFDPDGGEPSEILEPQEHKELLRPGSRAKLPTTKYHLTNRKDSSISSEQENGWYYSNTLDDVLLDSSRFETGCGTLPLRGILHDSLTTLGKTRKALEHNGRRSRSRRGKTTKTMFSWLWNVDLDPDWRLHLGVGGGTRAPPPPGLLPQWSLDTTCPNHHHDCNGYSATGTLLSIIYSYLQDLQEWASLSSVLSQYSITSANHSIHLGPTKSSQDWITTTTAAATTSSHHHHTMKFSTTDRESSHRPWSKRDKMLGVDLLLSEQSSTTTLWP